MMRVPRALRAVGLVVLVGCTALFAQAHWSPARTLVRDAGSVDLRLAVLGIACSVLAVVNRGALNQAAHRAVGVHAPLGAMTRTAAVGFAAQKIVKPATAASFAVFVNHGRRRGQCVRSVAAACTVAAVASFVALGALLTLTIVALWTAGRLTGWWIAAAIGFTVYALVIALLGIAALRDCWFSALVWRTGARVHQRWRRPDLPTAPGPPPELVGAVRMASRRPRDLLRTVVHAIGSKVLGAAMLALAIAAVGLPINAIDAVVIYATALAASTVSIVPGGFGAVEASTTAMLIGAGAEAGAAILAVALFRLFDLWLPVLFGAIAARGDLRCEPPSTGAVQEAEPAVVLALSAA